MKEKNDLIVEVIEKGLTISKAAKKLKINNSTAKVIIRKYKQEQLKLKKS
jgi:transposase